MEWLLWLVAAAIGARFIAQLILARLNAAEVERHRDAIPAVFRGVMDDAAYRKSVDYTLAKNRFGQVENVFDTALLVLVIFSGVLPVAWRFAQAFQGEGFLLPAPAMVDSIETKDALIKRCGIQEILDMADHLDAVVVSIGGINLATTFYRGGFLDQTMQKELESKGAVGDLLFHFFDRYGDLIDHAVNDRVMSVDVDRIRRAPLRILASGGAEKRLAMLGAMRLVQPTVLITDEESARAMLRSAEAGETARK